MSIVNLPFQVQTHQPDAAYRTLWRWHFYAGLFVMPFLFVLAITGTLYCFKPQLEPLLYPHLLKIEPRSGPRLDANTLLVAAQHAAPAGSIALSMQVLRDTDRSTEFVFRFPDGQQNSVYVNPYNGAVLGTLSVEDRFMQVDRMLHRKLLLGKPGELAMELAACWALVMIGTGVAMWWPRPHNGMRMAWLPRLTLRGRSLWKSIHTAMGIWLAIGATAFILTGLPWSGFWGQHFQQLATRADLGPPPGVWGNLPLHSTRVGTQALPATRSAAESHHHMQTNAMTTDQLSVALVPWAVGKVPVPSSVRTGPSGASGATTAPIAIDAMIARIAALGISTDYTLVLPTLATGVYTLTYFPPDPKQERTTYIDQYSGAVLRDIRYADYGGIARAVSYGTSLHMGRYFGLANQIVCALISLGLAAMAVTGTLMWWTRRPARSLGAPARVRTQSAATMRGWKIGLTLLGTVFPLMGLTLLAVWALDRLLLPLCVRRAA